MKRPIEFGIIRKGTPLNFSAIRNKTIKKPAYFQKLRKGDDFYSSQNLFFIKSAHRKVAKINIIMRG